MKTGITGATGKLGRIVIQKLREKFPEEDIIGLVRSPGKAADLKVETRFFDYDKPGSLSDQLNGLDTLLLISGSEIGQRARQHRNIINAAKTAGISWIIYTSILRADTSSISLAREHSETEKAIGESGIAYTFLRNGWYTENYTGSVKSSLASNMLIGSAGDGKISSASREDYAEAAVAVLTGKSHNGKVYELAGDEAYTLSDLAAEISRQTGKEISYRNLSENEYADTLKSLGVPENLAGEIAGWDVAASKGDLYDDSHQLSHLIMRPTTSLSEAIKKAL